MYEVKSKITKWQYLYGWIQFRKRFCLTGTG